MKNKWFQSLLFISLLAFGLLAIVLEVYNGRFQTSYADESDSAAFLPLVMRPFNTPTPTFTPTATATITPTITITPSPTLTPTPVDLNHGLDNGSFEEGWNDADTDKQKPIDWALYWLEVGDPLFDSNDAFATGSCECIHKHADQLPDPEKPGGPKALILDGVYAYKIFTSAKFGTELSQTISGLEPGSEMRMTLPIQLHIQNEDDIDQWSSESSLWVNDMGAWANAADMGDRRWCKHEQVFTVPDDGIAKIDVRVKSKYEFAVDFFIDDIRLTKVSESTPHAEMDNCNQDQKLKRYEPVQARSFLDFFMRR